MVGQVVSLFTCALLLLCFVAFSVASFRHFDPATDRLHPVGDLVRKGPDSVGVVRLLRQLEAGRIFEP